MSKSNRKSISKREYLALVGLEALAKVQRNMLDEIESAALEITKEVDYNGVPERGGHTMDMLWGSRELDDMLRILKIKVKKK